MLKACVFKMCIDIVSVCGNTMCLAELSQLFPSSMVTDTGPQTTRFSTLSIVRCLVRGEPILGNSFLNYGSGRTMGTSHLAMTCASLSDR